VSGKSRAQTGFVLTLKVESILHSSVVAPLGGESRHHRSILFLELVFVRESVMVNVEVLLFVTVSVVIVFLMESLAINIRLRALRMVCSQERFVVFPCVELFSSKEIAAKVGLAFRQIKPGKIRGRMPFRGHFLCREARTIIPSYRHGRQ
jgi:hypothetical protein